jgi:uncharacterized surface anchored protein
LDEAIKILLADGDDTLFGSLMSKLENMPQLKGQLRDVLMKGDVIAWRPYDNEQALLRVYGFIKNNHNTVAVANRVFEMLLASLPDPDDSTKAQAEGTVLLSKIAPETYYMIETSTPQGHEDGKVTIYKLTVNSDGTSNIERRLLSEEDDAYKEAYKNERDGLYHIMNISTSKRKVILRKVDKDTGVSLEGARFRIYRVDGTEVINSDYDKDKFYESGDSGVYFIDDLPYGTYRIDEVKEPTGYKRQSYTLTVSRDEVKVEPVA